MSWCSGFKEGFGDFGHNISVIINTVLLSAVYLIGVGVTALFARLLGKRFLDTKKRKSYWRKLDLGKEDLGNYYRQF